MDDVHTEHVGCEYGEYPKVFPTACFLKQM